MKKKLAFVVQRYGVEVNGGAELHCRQLVEHMAEAYADEYDIQVITTRAIDYVSWKNEYKEDEEVIHGVTVKRFPVVKPRNESKFNKLSAQVINRPHDIALEEEWFRLQGPECPALVDYIESVADEVDGFIFFTYLYYTTVMGLPKVAKKAIMIPTAHDEPPIYLKTFNKLFSMPAGLFYNTIEEKEFIEGKFGNASILNNGGHGGVGVEVPEHIDGEGFRKKHDLNRYMIYVGRIDAAKGCKQMFEYYERYLERNIDLAEDQKLKLVLVGKPVIAIPKNEHIISLGFVSDQDKFDAIAGSEFLIIPSQFESLSMVALEAMCLNRPILVNGRCSVLKGHCVHGNTGLYYKNYYEFEGCINYLLTHKKEANMMGDNGVEYVNTNYKWDVITGGMKDMIEKVIH